MTTATAIKARDLKSFIRDIPDFPKKGIIFKDITTLLNNAAAFKKAMDLLVKRYRTEKIDYVVAVESRGLFLVRFWPTNWAPALFRCVKRANFPIRPKVLPMPWNMAPIRWKSMRMLYLRTAGS